VAAPKRRVARGRASTSRRRCAMRSGASSGSNLWGRPRGHAAEGAGL